MTDYYTDLLDKAERCAAVAPVYWPGIDSQPLVAELAAALRATLDKRDQLQGRISVAVKSANNTSGRQP